MTARPLFSVVIDNYNYAQYLRDAVESALAQTWPNLEVIVVDDGSTDGSREVMLQYGERIRPVFQANGGQASALNAGVAAAAGEYVAFLDSDDVWHPDKVARVMAALERHPEAGWLRHRMEVVSADRRGTGTYIPLIRGERVRDPRPHAFLEQTVMALTSGIVLRRRVAGRIFPLASDALDLRYDADAYLVGRAAATGEPYLSIEDVLGLYRRHPQQRYTRPEDLIPTLERQIHVAEGLGAALGLGAVSSSAWKHRVVLAALQGRSRVRPALAGARRVAALAAVDPRLCARQALALGVATIAPGYWLRKLVRQQALLVGGGDAP